MTQPNEVLDKLVHDVHGGFDLHSDEGRARLPSRHTTTAPGATG